MLRYETGIDKSHDKPCRQSWVCGPTHVVPLQTRCHDCVVLLQLTVVRSPVLSTQASAGGSRLAQPTAAQHINISISNIGISRQYPSKRRRDLPLWSRPLSGFMFSCRSSYCQRLIWLPTALRLFLVTGKKCYRCCNSCTRIRINSGTQR